VVEEAGVPGENYLPWCKQLVNFITCGCESSAPFLQFTKPDANPCSNTLETSTLTITPRVLVSSVEDHEFIGGVMVSVLASSVVDHWFIGGVMVSVLVSRVVDREFIGGVMVSVGSMNSHSR
jgi:hypothetical protein